jgi:hypothetical protein
MSLWLARIEIRSSVWTYPKLCHTATASQPVVTEIPSSPLPWHGTISVGVAWLADFLVYLPVRGVES